MCACVCVCVYLAQLVMNMPAMQETPVDALSGRFPWRRDRLLFKYSWASLVAQGWRICLKCGRPGFCPWVGKIPWMRAWTPTPVPLPGESPWTEEPGSLQSMGSQWVSHNRVPEHNLTIDMSCDSILVQSRINLYTSLDYLMNLPLWVIYFVIHISLIAPT